MGHHRAASRGSPESLRKACESLKPTPVGEPASRCHIGERVLRDRRGNFLPQQDVWGNYHYRLFSGKAKHQCKPFFNWNFRKLNIETRQINTKLNWKAQNIYRKSKWECLSYEALQCHCRSIATFEPRVIVTLLTNSAGYVWVFLINLNKTLIFFL